MNERRLRTGFLISSLLFLGGSLLARYWIDLSLMGVLGGVAYSALSAEAYAALVRELGREDRNSAKLLFLIALKMALLAVFVYALSAAGSKFLWSCLVGFSAIIPAGSWAGRGCGEQASNSSAGRTGTP